MSPEKKKGVARERQGPGISAYTAASVTWTLLSVVENPWRDNNLDPKIWKSYYENLIFSILYSFKLLKFPLEQNL